MSPLRHATYSLLAALFLRPPDGALLRQLAALPPFDTVLSGREVDGALVESYEVRYQELFGFNLYPYESLFLSRTLMVNHGVDALTRLMATAGFDPAPYGAGAADHAGIEMAFMAHCIACEEGALRAGNPQAVGEARRWQATLVHGHLARWLPAAMLAMRAATSDPFYELVAALTLELTLEDTARLPAAEAILWLQDMPVDEPAAEDDDLTATIRPLVTPAVSGLFLTRAEIRAIGRALQLPVAMGERPTMLRQLFEAAGQFEQVEPLLSALDERWAGGEAEVTALIDAAPAWSPYGQAWLRRLKAGRALLASLRETWRQRDEVV